MILHILPDNANLDNPLFKWYLIFSHMSQQFSAILDIVQPYTNGLKVVDRVYYFAIRMALGFMSEAQKTTRDFFQSNDYQGFLNSVPNDQKQEFIDRSNQWIDYNSKNEWKHHSQIRNSCFHFASSEEDREAYEERFRICVSEILQGVDISLDLEDYQIDQREYRQDTFCDTLWFFGLPQGYNQIIGSLCPDDDNYAQDVSSRILHTLDLSYQYIFLVRDILSQYFIHIGFISEKHA